MESGKRKSFNRYFILKIKKWKKKKKVKIKNIAIKLFLSLSCFALLTNLKNKIILRCVNLENIHFNQDQIKNSNPPLPTTTPLPAHPQLQ